jgi:hypothetical protein
MSHGWRLLEVLSTLNSLLLLIEDCMPLFLEPGQKYPIVLDIDADKPKATQPTFYARSQSMRGQQKIADVLDQWTQNPDISIKELFAITVDVLSGVVIGWVNMGGKEFSAKELHEVLSYQEARELLRKVMYNQHITADEKKSIEFQT